MASKKHNPQQYTHFADQYLNRYAEPEAAVISRLPVSITNKIKAKNTIIVPAYNESIGFLSQLKSASIKDSFFIVVINAPDNSEVGEEKNRTLFNFAHTIGKKIWELDNIELFSWPKNNFFILVDRFTGHRKIPRKQGVGLARKIACDISVCLIRQKLLSSHFIHSTDADVTLPVDYLQQTKDITGLKNISAAVYNFSHSKEKTPIAEATDIYEQSMRYYVDGLHWANSHFAFHTIGSCLAISVEHYCKARGFPKKSGGEDFYLLNKLAKLGDIKTLNGKPILINSRVSDRVPFGTGPAVAKIMSSGKNLSYPVYHPQIFIELKELLSQFNRLTETAYNTNTDKNTNKNGNTSSFNEVTSYEQWFLSLSPITRTALSSLNIKSLFSHLINNCRSPNQKREHITYWFDGFKTLKYIHFLQQHQYPAIPFHLALKRSNELGF